MIKFISDQLLSNKVALYQLFIINVLHNMFSNKNKKKKKKYDNI